jgi:hypothetical protein
VAGLGGDTIALPGELEYYKTRKLLEELEADKARVRNLAWLRGPKLQGVDYLEYVSPVAFFDPDARRLLNPWFGNELETVQPVLYEAAAAVGEFAQVPVPAGEIWDVLDIVGSALMDVNVGNRTCNITVLGHPIVAIAPIDFVATTGIVLAANQVGGSILSSGMAPNLITNTNGVLALVANENFIPQRLNAGAIISHENDNLAVGVGDIMEVGVHYRRVA